MGSLSPEADLKSMLRKKGVEIGCGCFPLVGYLACCLQGEFLEKAALIFTRVSIDFHFLSYDNLKPQPGTFQSCPLL